MKRVEEGVDEVLLLFVSYVRTAKSDSVSWDESQHLYSGWLSWERGDFGYNPEVPPLVKMWDAIPLLRRDIKQPAFTGDHFKKEGFVLGQRFLAANGIERTLIPVRIMAERAIAHHVALRRELVVIARAARRVGDELRLFELDLARLDAVDDAVVEEALELPEDALARTWESLRSVGNLSSASVLFVLADLIAAGEAAPGDKGLVVAMGPGFCSELVLLAW